MTDPVPVAPLRLRPRDRDSIVSSLRAGVVPQRGFAHIQVGRADEVAAVAHDWIGSLTAARRSAS